MATSPAARSPVPESHACTLTRLPIISSPRCPCQSPMHVPSPDSPSSPLPVATSVLLLPIGGMKVKADRDESSPYAAMLAAQDVTQRCKELGIAALHIKLRATGANKTETPGPGAQSALGALARSGMKIGRIGV